jgi:hypothetical protein
MIYLSANPCIVSLCAANLKIMSLIVSDLT